MAATSNGGGINADTGAWNNGVMGYWDNGMVAADEELFIYNILNFRITKRWVEYRKLLNKVREYYG